MYRNIDINTNEKIKIGILHKKKTGWIYYFTNYINPIENCPVCNNNEENFCEINNDIKVEYFFRVFKDYLPILFVVGFGSKNIINKNASFLLENNNSMFFLNDCLDLFCEEELLNNENMWYCSHCKKRKIAKKQIKLSRPPNYLIIQIKKFTSTSGFFYSSNEKKNVFVYYPIHNLDLSNYFEEGGGDRAKYDLYAVIQHHGNISEGHYTAICKINDFWVLYNDSSLSKISSPVTKDAYLLFYKKS